ncbi:MAG: hypothetical protein K8U03_13120 [Planctomycetia bacterium]|nr:hypothetical protein [Planctomycetia bacterium]
MSTSLPLEAAEFRMESPGEMSLRLEVDDPETIAALAQFAEGAQREAFALKALRIGVLALGQARGQIDTVAVRGECERMLVSLQSQLGEHARSIQQKLAGSLQEYFDPQNGRFHDRVERLIKRDGELEQVLRRQVGHDDSLLSKTLAAHFGVESPLMKRLNPNEAEGLLAALRETFGKQLETQREAVLKEFSLNNRDGALARLVGELTENQGKLTTTLQGKIENVVKEFSLNDDNSALSVLVKKVTHAQQMITGEFSLDNDQSALCKLTKLLKSTDTAIHDNLTLDNDASALSRLKRELVTILDGHAKTNREFQEEVKVAVATITAKKEAERQTTRHGLVFEQALFTYLQDYCKQTGDMPEFLGNSTGLIKNCKKGDCVVEIGPEHAAAGAKIVLEAKEVVGFDLRQARAEIEEGRKNRDAQIGLFVYSKKTAPSGIEPITRFGDDVILVWDAEDPATDLFLRLGLTVARALCTRRRDEREAQKVDFTLIDKALLAIKKRYDDFDLINKHAEDIIGTSQKIKDRARIAREDLERQVDRLEQQVTDLKQLANISPE